MDPVVQQIIAGAAVVILTVVILLVVEFFKERKIIRLEKETERRRFNAMFEDDELYLT